MSASTGARFTFPVMTQHYAMLQRNLLYTGVTRGKRLVVLVGQKKAAAIAVRNVSGRQRWSKLRQSGCVLTRLAQSSSDGLRADSAPDPEGGPWTLADHPNVWKVPRSASDCSGAIELTQERCKNEAFANGAQVEVRLHRVA